MLTRKPITARKLYPSDFIKLENQIKVCYLDKQGPGDFPVNRKNKRLFGVICPNANYSDSGACSAWSFKEISETEFPDTYIILGHNNGAGNEFSTFTFISWETPFGIIDINKVIGLKLIKLFPKIINEAEPFLNNQTIEVQLPFLQYASRDKFGELTFLPVLIKSESYDDIIKLGSALFELKEEYNFKINLIISSNIIGDEEALNYIKKLDSKGYYDYLNKNNLLNKGASPIIAGIEYVRLLNGRARLLNYYKSKEENEIYGAFVFE